MKKLDRKVLAEQIRRVRLAGEAMSNVCFNLAQDANQAEHLRRTFKDCQRDWDNAIGELDVTKL